MLRGRKEAGNVLEASGSFNFRTLHFYGAIRGPVSGVRESRVTRPPDLKNDSRERTGGPRGGFLPHSPESETGQLTPDSPRICSIRGRD